jgi:hypothetical protein
MNDYKVTGQLQDGPSFSFTVSCEDANTARAIVFNNFAKVNINRALKVKLFVVSMDVVQLDKVGA